MGWGMRMKATTIRMILRLRPESCTEPFNQSLFISCPTLSSIGIQVNMASTCTSSEPEGEIQMRTIPSKRSSEGLLVACTLPRPSPVLIEPERIVFGVSGLRPDDRLSGSNPQKMRTTRDYDLNYHRFRR